jgi:FkbM family methyltransferase
MVSEALQGVFRSLRLYHGKDAPKSRMDALYSRFVQSGDLVFDIGAHVGDRISSFRRLGARVIAVEPQPLLQRALRLIHGRDPAVLLMPAAIAAESGHFTLHLNSRNPTVSTLSDAFMIEAFGADGWEDQFWDQTMEVPAVTLDRLIEKFGPPMFIKIDVEGFEDEVLKGLSQAVPALSFEFTTIARDVALRCLDRLAKLGPYRFDVVLGESQTPTFQRWITAQEMSLHLSNLPHAANSGDVYAILPPGE